MVDLVSSRLDRTFHSAIWARPRECCGKRLITLTMENRVSMGYQRTPKTKDDALFSCQLSALTFTRPHTRGQIVSCQQLM